MIDKFRQIDKKIYVVCFLCEEEKLLLNLYLIDMVSTYNITQNKLEIFETPQQDIVDKEVQEFKKNVVKFSKEINNYNNHLKLFKQTR